MNCPFADTCTVLLPAGSGWIHLHGFGVWTRGVHQFSWPTTECTQDGIDCSVVGTDNFCSQWNSVVLWNLKFCELFSVSDCLIISLFPCVVWQARWLWAAATHASGETLYGSPYNRKLTWPFTPDTLSKGCRFNTLPFIFKTAHQLRICKM